MSVCKYCKAPIIWIKMKSGKIMPCNDDILLYRKNPDGHVKIVTDDGRVVGAELVDNAAVADGVGYISHYVTCPGADRFRRR